MTDVEKPQETRDEAAYAAGRRAAEVDVARGRLMYRWGGHAGHWGHWIVQELAERYGMTVDDGFGVDMVSLSENSFKEGYNSVSVAELDRRHGPGTFNGLLAESREQSETVLSEARRVWRDARRMP